jgi:hypothetical protein
MTMLFRLLPALILLGLAACSPEKPYVVTDYRFHQRGIVQVCYDEGAANLEQAQQLVEDVCRQYDRTAKAQLVQPYQCSWRAPVQATFACVPRPGENPGPILLHSAPMRHDTPLPPW